VTIVMAESIRLLVRPEDEDLRPGVDETHLAIEGLRALIALPDA